MVDQLKMTMGRREIEIDEIINQYDHELNSLENEHKKKINQLQYENIELKKEL